MFPQLTDDDLDMKDSCAVVEVDFWEIQIKIWSCKNTWPVPLSSDCDLLLQIRPL